MNRPEPMRSGEVPRVRLLAGMEQGLEPLWPHVKPSSLSSCWEHISLSDILMVWWLITEHSGSLSFFLSMYKVRTQSRLSVTFILQIWKLRHRQRLQVAVKCRLLVLQLSAVSVGSRCPFVFQGSIPARWHCGSWALWRQGS